jgi:UDP-N-acetylmuramoylalanine--D-glutamate ligase
MYVICFGAEASQLATWCQEHQKQALVCATLDQAFVHIQSIVREGMVVLFSPSGSSYDLYKNYEERGAHFKQLVHAYMGKGF